MSRIVALRALGLGDLLTAVPALRALQRHGRVTVAAPRALAPLAALAGVELVDAGELQPLPEQLAEADLLVNLHGRGPRSHRIALAAAPRRLLAFSHPDVPQTAGMPAWRDDEHETERWCRLLREAGIAADARDLRLRLPAPPEPAWACGATVVHPGAASAARRWPPERFARVAASEAAAGRTVVITGGPAERALGAEVAFAAGLPRRALLAGRTSVAQLAALVAHAGRVVCGDTGVAHLATAFGIPSVVVFGPTPPAAWGPPGPPAPHRVLWAGVRGDPHGDRPHDGLLQIAPGDVVAELAGLP